MSRSVRVWRVLLTGLLVIMAIAWLLPAVWVLVTSLKPTENIVRVPPEWIPWPATIGHYGEVLFSSSRTARIGRAFFNSIVVSLGSVAVVVLTSAMAAYPLARMRFRGRDLVFGLLVGSLMVPNAVILVPQYVLVQRLGWLSTYQTRIVLPLSQPVLGALAIFAFRSAWNDFLWPLIAVNKPDMFPLPVALALLRGAYAAESYGPIMAGAVLSALPLLIVFLVANRRIVEGVRVSALKG